MRKNKLKIFINSKNIPCTFDPESLKAAFKKYKMKKAYDGIKMTDEIIREELAKKLYVTPEAIKNWLYGYNGPGSLDQIVTMAEYLGIKHDELLKEEKEEMMENKEVLTTESNNNMYDTREILKSIYLQMLEIHRSLFSINYGIPTYDDEGTMQFEQPNNIPEGVTEEEIEYYNQMIEEEKEFYRNNENFIRKASRELEIYIENNMFDIPSKLYDMIMEYIENHINIYVSHGTNISTASMKKLYDKYGDGEPESGITYCWDADHQSMFYDSAEELSETIYQDFMKEVRILFKNYIAK